MAVRSRFCFQSLVAVKKSIACGYMKPIACGSKLLCSTCAHTWRYVDEIFLVLTRRFLYSLPTRTLRYALSSIHVISTHSLETSQRWRTSGLCQLLSVVQDFTVFTDVLIEVYIMSVSFKVRLPQVKHLFFDSIWCESTPERINERRKRKTDFYQGGISALLCFSCLSFCSWVYITRRLIYWL